ncbi:hypothetical protein FRC10_009623 [Ceratobasidium sp. 414]|nr:hypothetical protein FRC10_009623 [Ceratobasidium sp. 414]
MGDMPPPPPPKHLNVDNSPGYPASNPPPPPGGREPKAKRGNPLVDLIDTEKEYLELLSAIIRKVAAAWSRSNFPPRELDGLFRGVEAVYKANRALNTKLKEIGPNPSDPKALGDLLMRWIDDLDPPYTRFINAYASGFDTWRPVQQNPNLARILGDLGNVLTSSPPQEWTLDKLFGAPEKRLRYYKKLYSRLLKTTSPGRSDHRLLVGANEKLDRLIATCEENRNTQIGDPNDHDTPGLGVEPLPQVAYLPHTVSPVTGPAPHQPIPSAVAAEKPVPAPAAPAAFQLPPLSFHAEDHPVPHRNDSTDAPTITPEIERDATIVGHGQPNGSAPPSRVQSPEIAPLSNAFRRPVDGERVSSSTMGSRIDSMSSNGRMSRDTTFSSASPGSLDFSLMPAKELERKLCTDNVMDIFSMTPRNCKLQMNPPNLPFTRTVKFSVDTMIFFTPRVTGLEVVHRRGHLFLTTDLLLICEKMSAEEQAGFGPDGPDMWLCYPPLAGKHLQVSEISGGQGMIATLVHNSLLALTISPENAFQLTVMKKEVLTIHAESRHMRDQIMRDIQECAERGATLTPIRTNLSPGPGVSPSRAVSPGPGLPRSPAPPNGERGPAGLPANPSPHHGQQRGPEFGSVPGPFPPNIRSPPPGPMSAPTSRAPSVNQDRFGPPMGPGPIGYGGPPGGQWHPPARGASMPGGPPAQGPPGQDLRRPPAGEMHGPPLRSQSSSKSLNSEYVEPGRDGPLPPIPRMPDAARIGASAPSSMYSEFGPPRLPFAQPGPILSPSQNNFPRNAQSGPGSQGLSSEYDVSPPESPVDERPTGPVTQSITCETRCKVFSQQQHQQWKSLGAARLKLYRTMPTNIKQLVVEADTKSKNILISTIVLTDGVERVGKTGIAIELSDKGARTGVVYMIQLKNESSANGLFDALLAGSDRAR